MITSLATSAAAVMVQLFSAQRILIATTGLTIPINRYVVREITELFQMNVPPGTYVRIVSTGPVQTMGIAVNNAGHATPVLSR